MWQEAKETFRVSSPRVAVLLRLLKGPASRRVASPGSVLPGLGQQ